MLSFKSSFVSDSSRQKKFVKSQIHFIHVFLFSCKIYQPPCCSFSSTHKPSTRQYQLAPSQAPPTPPDFLH